MDAFLKSVLEPSEQDVFDHLTRMETPLTNTFKSPSTEESLPSTNMALPGHLVQCSGPWPAYTTCTAPVVKMLIEQDKRRKAASYHLAKGERNREPQEAGFEEETQVLSKLSRGSSTPRTGKDSVGISKAENSSSSPSVCRRIIFARNPALCVQLCSPLAHSSKKK